MIFKSVRALMFDLWLQVKLMMLSLHLEAFLHQLSAEATMRCSTRTVSQQERRSLLEIQVESTALLA